MGACFGARDRILQTSVHDEYSAKGGVVSQDALKPDPVDPGEYHEHGEAVVRGGDPPDVRILGVPEDVRVEVTHGETETEESETGETGEEIERARGDHDAVERLGQDISDDGARHRKHDPVKGGDDGGVCGEDASAEIAKGGKTRRADSRRKETELE